MKKGFGLTLCFVILLITPKLVFAVSPENSLPNFFKNLDKYKEYKFMDFFKSTNYIKQEVKFNFNVRNNYKILCRMDLKFLPKLSCEGWFPTIQTSLVRLPQKITYDFSQKNLERLQNEVVSGIELNPTLDYYKTMNVGYKTTFDVLRNVSMTDEGDSYVLFSEFLCVVPSDNSFGCLSLRDNQGFYFDERGLHLVKN